MRPIHKPDHFSTFALDKAQAKGAPISADEATDRWDNFNGYKALTERLLIEQYGLCCYTELNLTELARHQNLGSHIEHEQPKSRYPERTFDYRNLLLCALASDDLGQFAAETRFGGHFKGGLYDPALFISPQDTECRQYFIYSSTTGEIGPNLARSEEDQGRAQYTIDLLNLNAPFLRAERRQWLQELEEELNRLLDEGAVEAIEYFAELELTLTQQEHPNMDFPVDQLRKFHSAARELFNGIGERVIQRCCPEAG